MYESRRGSGDSYQSGGRQGGGNGRARRDPPVVDPTTHTGTVKWFNKDKGYGFITPNTAVKTADNKSDVFVHISAILEAGYQGLNEGDTVKYQLATDTRSNKTSAVNLDVNPAA